MSTRRKMKFCHSGATYSWSQSKIALDEPTSSSAWTRNTVAAKKKKIGNCGLAGQQQVVGRRQVKILFWSRSLRLVLGQVVLPFSIFQ